MTTPQDPPVLAIVKRRMDAMVVAMPATGQMRARFKQAAIALAMNPSLQKCTPESVAKSIYVCARLNLIPDPALQECAVVPFKNHGVAEATFMCMYKGLIKLARNSDPGLEVNTGRVYSNDVYTLEEGMEQVFKITKRWWEVGGDIADPGEFLFSYCVSRQGNAAKPRLVIVSAAEGRGIAAKARGDVWQTNFEAMCDKTAVRRSAKLWSLDADKPDTQRFRQAVALDENVDGEPMPVPNGDDLLDGFEERKIEVKDGNFKNPEDALGEPPTLDNPGPRIPVVAGTPLTPPTPKPTRPVKPFKPQTVTATQLPDPIRDLTKPADPISEKKPPFLRLASAIEEKMMKMGVEPQNHRVEAVIRSLMTSTTNQQAAAKLNNMDNDALSDYLSAVSEMGATELNARMGALGAV